MGLEVGGEDASEVGFGLAVGRAVVVGEVEMRHPAVEGTAQDGALGAPGMQISKIVPESERHRRKHETAGATTAILHVVVPVLSCDVGTHCHGHRLPRARRSEGLSH